MKIDINCTLISPLFSQGAYKDHAEIRPPSIRGQLHRWFRALGGRFEQEQAVFGSIGRQAHATPVVVRVSLPEGGRQENISTLPHKQGGFAASRQAWLPGTRFDVHLVTRRQGLGAHEAFFLHTLEAWLLMGGIGARTTRAAGNFTWTCTGADLHSPSAADAYEQRCQHVLRDTPLETRLLNKVFPSEEAARKCASDTIGGRSPKNRPQPKVSDLAQWNYPLGAIKPNRKTSPLSLRLVALEGGLRLLAVWDPRNGNKKEDLRHVAEAMQKKEKPLGELLLNAFFP